MPFPSLPLFSHTLSQNPTHKRTSQSGLVPDAFISNSNTRLNTSSSSVTSPDPTPSSPITSSSKPRQKSKTQSRPKTHHVNSTDSRSKSKIKAELKPKGNKLRMRVKRDILDAPGANTTAIPYTRGPALGDTSVEDLKEDQIVDEYPDGTPSPDGDKTEGEADAETDLDTEAEADTSVEAETSHRTLTVDPFSAEEERIITVLSRKLEQLRESETTSTSLLASSPPVPLPSSTTADSVILNTHGLLQAAGTSAYVSLAAVKPSDEGRLGADSSRTSQQMVSAPKDKTNKHSQKRTSPPPTSASIAGTLNGGVNKDYPTGHVSSHEYTHSRASSVDSGIYASPSSPAPSSPSSVYAAGAASPIKNRNGPAHVDTIAGSNGKAKSNDYAVPIAVNGSATSSSHTNGIPTEFYSRAYGPHISTLSSPEMSLSTSPCEAYDTRWMATKRNPNGTGVATANGNMSSPSNNGSEKARFGGLQATQDHSYEEGPESQTQTQLMLSALMQENDQLKTRISEMEGNYLNLARSNEAYRVELIGYRTRLGLSVDNLIGLASDPLPESLPSATRFASTSVYTHAQGPQAYQHQRHPPPSSFGNAFNNQAFNSYALSNGNTAYHQNSAAPSNASSPGNSTGILNPPSSTTTRNVHHRAGGNYVPNRSDCIPNEFGYENSLNGITGISRTSNARRNTAAMSSTTSTNCVPIPRPPSQMHTNRLRQVPMMTTPMSVPNMDDPLLYMHGSTSRSVNEPPYSNNSPALLSPSYSSSYSAASSAASSSAASSASTNVTSPPSSLSFPMMMMLPPAFGVASRGLSYPLVPPPSLSSSLGSGSGVWEGAGGASGNLSPVDSSGPSIASRRGSNAGMGIGRRGSLTGGGAGSAGGRVIDPGSLRRSRGGSLNHGPGYISRPETVDETEGDHEDTSTLEGLAAIREP